MITCYPYKILTFETFQGWWVGIYRLDTHQNVHNSELRKTEKEAIVLGLNWIIEDSEKAIKNARKQLEAQNE